MVISTSPLPSTASNPSPNQAKAGKTTTSSSSSSSSSPSLIPRRSKRLSGDSATLEGTSPSPAAKGSGAAPTGGAEVKPKGARAKGKQLGWATSPELQQSSAVLVAKTTTTFASPPGQGVSSSSDIRTRVHTPGVNTLGGHASQPCSGATSSTIHSPSGPAPRLRSCLTARPTPIPTKHRNNARFSTSTTSSNSSGSMGSSNASPSQPSSLPRATKNKPSHGKSSSSKGGCASNTQTNASSSSAQGQGYGPAPSSPSAHQTLSLKVATHPNPHTL